MEIGISLSGPQISAEVLTRAVGFRVLDHRLLREDQGFAVYAFVCYSEDDTGDYEVKLAKLRRQSLVGTTYKLSDVFTVAQDFQSVYDASKHMDSLNARGRFTSLSAPPPISSAVFFLSDFEIPIDPDLSIRLDAWVKAQKICPIRYAIVNPRNESIEVAFSDPSAYNSEIVQRMLRDSLYAALGDYSAGHDSTIPDRA